MRRLATLSLLAITCCVALSAHINAAPLVVDTFQTPAVPVVATSGALNSAVLGVHSGPGILGTRTVSYDKAGVNPLDPGDHVQVGAGTLFLASGPNLDGITVTAQYAGFGVVNLTGFGTLDLIFQPVFDKGIGIFDVVATLSTTTGNLTATVIVPASFTPGGGTLSIPLSSFTGPGNLSSVNGITLAINDGGSPSPAADFQLTQVEFTPIPEPASMALWGVLCVAGAWYGRRRFAKPMLA